MGKGKINRGKGRALWEETRGPSARIGGGHLDPSLCINFYSKLHGETKKGRESQLPVGSLFRPGV